MLSVVLGYTVAIANPHMLSLHYTLAMCLNDGSTGSRGLHQR